jgi:hypothetical protein
LLLGHVLAERSGAEYDRGRITIAERFAEEAMHFAGVASDGWTMAMAACAKTQGAANADELRNRVDLAASLLEKVGNVYQLAQLFSSASYLALNLGSDADARHYVTRALPLTQELDSPQPWVLLHGNAGLAALLTGDAGAARDAFREELRVSRELVAPHFAAEGLAGLAAIATVGDDLSRAARLYGAAAARSDAYEDPVHERLHRTYFEPARSRHGPDGWDAAARDGAALSFEDAIAYALQAGAIHARPSNARAAADVPN